MTEFSVIPAKLYHVGQIVHRMRDEHRNALTVIGIEPHRALRQTFYESTFARAWLIDGRLAGLGGVTGPLASGVGWVWLILSNEALRYPVAVIKESRRQLDEIMRTKTELVTTVIGDDRAAQRLAVFLGFHVGHDEFGQPAYSKSGRAILRNTLERNPELRVPIGKGFAIQMGYHEGTA